MDGVKVVVIGTMTFLFGLALGLGYAAYRYKQDQAFVLALLDLHSMDNAHEIATRLKTIEAAQSQNMSWIISVNCSRIRATLPFASADLFPAERRGEWTELFRRASNEVKELENAQMCPKSPRSNSSFKPKPLRGSA